MRPEDVTDDQLLRYREELYGGGSVINLLDDDSNREDIAAAVNAVTDHSRHAQFILGVMEGWRTASATEPAPVLTEEEREAVEVAASGVYPPLRPDRDYAEEERFDGYKSTLLHLLVRTAPKTTPTKESNDA